MNERQRLLKIRKALPTIADHTGSRQRFRVEARPNLYLPDDHTLVAQMKVIRNELGKAWLPEVPPDLSVPPEMRLSVFARGFAIVDENRNEPLPLFEGGFFHREAVTLPSYRLEKEPGELLSLIGSGYPLKEECSKCGKQPAEYYVTHLVSGIRRTDNTRPSLCRQCHPLEQVLNYLDEVVPVRPLARLTLEYYRCPLYRNRNSAKLGYTSHLLEWMCFCYMNPPDVGADRRGCWLVNCNPRSELYGYVLYNGSSDFEYLCPIAEFTEQLTCFREQIKSKLGPSINQSLGKRVRRPSFRNLEYAMSDALFQAFVPDEPAAAKQKSKWRKRLDWQLPTTTDCKKRKPRKKLDWQ